MTGAVSLEEYAEEADRRMRELPDLPMDLSDLAAAPHIPGSLHTAVAGDSISSIMSSSDPAAIGAFMQANDLKGTHIRAGESYIVPEQGSFTAPGARTLGQHGLNTDNALATQSAQDRLDRSMTAIGNTMSGFDPLKGLLATRPNPVLLPSNEQSGPGFGYENAGELAGHLGRFAGGTKGFVNATQDVGEKVLGAKDNFNTVKSVTRGLARANLGLAAAESALGMAEDLQNGVPAKIAIPGAALHGGASLAAGALGTLGGTAAAGLIGQMLIPVPGLGYIAGAGGGILASYLADRYLPSREQFGRAFQKANKAYGEQPHLGLL